MEESNFDRQTAFDHTAADYVDRSEPLDVQQDTSTVIEETEKKGMAAGPSTMYVMEPRASISPTALRPWRPWTQVLTVSPHASQILIRGAMQPVAMLGLPIVWWIGLMYGIYQIWFNSEDREGGGGQDTTLTDIVWVSIAMGSVISFALTSPPYCKFAENPLDPQYADEPTSERSAAFAVSGISLAYISPALTCIPG